MNLIILIIVILLLIGALPTWPYSTGWGYYPSGGLGLVLFNTPHLVATRSYLTTRAYQSAGNLRRSELRSYGSAQEDIA